MIARLTLLAVLWLAASRTAVAAESPLILISLDGFRWDYTDKYATEAPTLRSLRREGVAARGLIPAFPSNTFPNHYTLVTGQYPSQHGVVNNEFFDTKEGTYFRYFQPAVTGDAKWWGGEPIWVTAIRQGRKAGAHFWIGSEVEIGGVRPDFWVRYDYKIPFSQRLEDLAGWLSKPAGIRPDLIAFYLEETNSAGHRFGPDSPETAAAVKQLDGHVASILARVRSLGFEPNLVIVSDHGMTETSLARTVALDDYLDLQTVQIDTDGSVVSLRPRSGKAEDLVRALERLPHARAYLAENLPGRFRVTPTPRVAPVWILPEGGWHVGTRASIERLRVRYPEKGYLGGDHGYDPDLPDMRGIFIAHGPAFRRGVELPECENVHVYALLCAVLKLKPGRHDGDDRLVKAALQDQRQAGMTPADSPGANAPSRPIPYSEVAALSAPPADHRVPYGEDPPQFGELRLPSASAVPHPVVVLVHGGCWQGAFDIAHSRPMAAALAAAGFAVWSIEYRRLGNPGGGWPGTFRDVAAGTDFLRTLATPHRLDLSRVVAVGHSAGGQLALWLASRGALAADDPLFSSDPLPIRGVVGLAAVSDLAAFGAGPGSCNASVATLLGGSPETQGPRYAAVDPMRRLPLRVPVRLIHGALDSIVLPAQSQHFESAARAAGTDARCLALEGAGHFDLIAPTSPHWPAIVAAIRGLAGN